MSDFRVNYDGRIIGLDAIGPEPRCVLFVSVSPGTSLLIDIADSFRVIGLQFVDNLATESDVLLLTDHTPAFLRRQGTAAASVRISDLPQETLVVVARLAMLRAFAVASYFPLGSSGLVAAEQLALVEMLSQAGFASDLFSPRLAIDAVNALLRFITVVRPSEGSSLVAQAARACIRHLPATHPALSALDQLLADVGDPSTASMWLDFELASLIKVEPRSKSLLRSGSSDLPNKTGDPFTFPVVWPQRVRPNGLIADLAVLEVKVDATRQVLDVELSSAPATGVSPYPCARAVGTKGGVVLAVAPFFGDQREVRAHLYLDSAFTTADVRVEIAALPDDPVLSQESYNQRVFASLSIAYLRAKSLSDTDLAENALHQISQLGHVATFLDILQRPEWQRFLADDYGVK